MSFQNLKNERYRFKIVINELEKATNIEYQVALLAFINCVIISAASLQDRIRVRNEFIGELTHFFVSIYKKLNYTKL